MNKENHLNLIDESITYELLCLLNLAKLNEIQIIKIQILLYKVKNWNLFFHLIDLNSVGLLSYKRLEKYHHDPNLNLKFKNHLYLLQNKILNSRKRINKSLLNLNIILEKMQQYRIEVIVLKGSLFANEIYEIPDYKKMNDIDILIRFEQVKEASIVLKELGYFCIIDKLDENTEFSKKTHHAPPYISSDKECVVGIHWGIHATNSCWNADIGGIWRRKEEITICNITAYRMSWEDNLIHLCIHLPFYKIGLREIADIYNLLIYSDPHIHYETLMQRIIEWNAFSPVYRALSFVVTLVPQFINIYELNFILNICKNYCSSYLIHDTNIRSSSHKILFSSRSTYISKIEKLFFVFKISGNYFEKLKAWTSMWSLTFFPPEIEVRKISRCYHDKKSIKYKLASLQTPFLILNSLARDHSLKLILMITFTNVIIIFLETIKFSFLRKQNTVINSNLNVLFKELE